MSFEITDHVSRPAIARITGALYLSFILVSVLADALGHIGLGSAAQLHDAITAGDPSFRLGLTLAYVSTFIFLMAAWGLYLLLRPVNRDLALLFLLLNAVGVAIQCASMLHLVSAMHVGEGGLPGFTAVQTDAAAQLSIEVYRSGFVLAQLFFGTWLFPLGYLVYRSGFLPRTLGVLLMLDGVGLMIWFLQALLLPDLPAIKIPGTIVSLVAEVGLGLWLLIRGVKSDESEAVPRHPSSSTRL